MTNNKRVRFQAINRQLCILKRLSGASNGLAKGELANEFNVSKKTIERDISNLSSVYYPIFDDIDKERGGQLFYYIHKTDNIPQLTFNDNEYFSLIFTYKMAYPLRPFLEQYIENGMVKIKSQTSEKLINLYKKMWDNIIPDIESVLNFDDHLMHNVCQIMKSFYDYRQIKIKYNSFMAKTKKEHILTPLCLKMYQNNIYLAGLITKNNKILTFALNRILEVQVLEERQIEIQFDPEEFFNASFGVYSGNIFNVRLLFSSEVSPWICEREWHKKQKIKSLANGEIILELPVSSMIEIKKFILSYGDQVRVLDPPELIAEITETIKKMQGRYE